MICQDCGFENKPTSKHCTSCGAKLRDSLVQQADVLPDCNKQSNDCPPPLTAVAKSIPNSNEKSCPYCAETIKSAAVKCRFCGSNLEEKKTPDPDRNQIQFLKEDLPPVSLKSLLEQAISRKDFTEAVSLLPQKYQAAFQSEVDRQKKGTGVAYVLYILLGLLGAHKFYIGEAGWGFVYLLCACGFFLVVPLIVLGIAFVCDSVLIPSQVQKANDQIRVRLLREIAQKL